MTNMTKSKRPYLRRRVDLFNSLSEIEHKILSKELRLLLGAENYALKIRENCYYQMFFDSKNDDFHKNGFCLGARRDFTAAPYYITLIKPGTEFNFKHYSGPKIFEEDIYFQLDKRLIVKNQSFKKQIQKVTKEPVYLIGTMSIDRIEFDVVFAYIKLDRCILPSGKIYCEIEISVKPSCEDTAKEFFEQKIKRYFDLIPDLRPMTKYDRFRADIKESMNPLV